MENRKIFEFVEREQKEQFCACHMTEKNRKGIVPFEKNKKVKIN